MKQGEYGILNQFDQKAWQTIRILLESILWKSIEQQEHDKAQGIHTKLGKANALFNLQWMFSMMLLVREFQCT